MPLPLIGAGMGAAIGGIGGALVGAAGSLFSGKQSADFAERSYKHRYQWQVKDMQKAGLNPMLSFQHGAPNVPQPQFPNVGEGAVKGFSAAMAARQVMSQINLNDKLADKAHAEAQSAYQTNRINELQAEINQWLRNPENIAILRRVALESPQVALEKASQDVKHVGATIEHILQSKANLGIDEQFKLLDLSKQREVYEFAVRLAKAQTMLVESGLPEAQAWAEVWSKYGKGLIYSREAKGWVQMFIDRFNFFGFKGSNGMQMPSPVGQPQGMGGFPYVN